MSVLDRIDRAVFRVVDGVVLWCWNELGVPWRTLASVLLSAALATAVARGSGWGAHFDARFWGWVATNLVVAFLLAAIINRASIENISRVNLLTRSRPLARFFRLVSVLFVASDAVICDWREITADTIALLLLLVVSAAIPMGPRKRRERRHVAPAFARVAS